MQRLAYDRFGALYAFGWRHLGAALRAHLWFYLLLILIATVAATVNQPVAQFIASYIDLLAIFPALAFATRLARPSFRMGAREVLGLTVIWMILSGSFFVFGYVFSALVRISDGFIFLAAAMIVPMAWISTKLALAQAMLLLRSPGATILEALSGSWDYVEGDTWWRIVGLNIVILLPLFAASLYTRHWSQTLTSSLVISVLTVVTTVWMQISLVAMASNTGVPEEHTGAVPV